MKPDCIFAIVASFIYHVSLVSGDSRSGKVRKGSKGSKGTKHDVCVVGGGPAGVYASHLLEKRGYAVTLFEKDAVLGGKTVPSMNPDGTENIRHLYTGSMVTVKDVIDQFGMEGKGTPLPPKNIFTTLGQIIPESTIPPTQEQLEAFEKYVLLTAPTGPVYPYTVPPTNTNLPAELTVPFEEWAAANNVTAIISSFNDYVTNYGYDFIQRVPAIYILKYLAFGSFSNVEVYPYHHLVQELGQSLLDVRTESLVESIQVEKKYQRIKVKYERNPVLCEKTIIAYPQTSESMAVIRGSIETTKIFDEVQFVFYHELFVVNDELISGIVPSNSTYSQEPKTGFNNEEPNIYFRFQDNEGLGVLFNSAEVDYSEEAVMAIVKEHILKLWSFDVPDKDITYYRKHVYFPHVSSATIENGFYETIAQNQGVNGLYFTGGLLRFELVDSAMNHAKYLVEKFFPDKTVA